MSTPLADKIRPKTLDDVVGQEHILGAGKPLRRIIESGHIPNMIFYGVSGTGKTTVARIIAENSGMSLHKLNGTSMSVGDIKNIVSEVNTFMGCNGILLYLDEIQYLNKKQQQSLLEYIENGSVTLIASTTENPYFSIFSAILSRCTIFEFKPVLPSDVKKAVERAYNLSAEDMDIKLDIDDGVSEHISMNCGGDVRKAVNTVELSIIAGEALSGGIRITIESVKQLAQRSNMRYDRDGDQHYDLLSAFQKSIRGSDENAALHYMARLLEAGDLISVTRRLLVTACEDIGLAYPSVIPIVKSCADIALQTGLPEARIPLADAVILLCTSPKSNSGYMAVNEAMKDLENNKSPDFPRHLQNCHYDGTGAEVRGQNYLYPHDYPNHYVRQQYLPDSLKDRIYYKFGDNKFEQSAYAYRKKIKPE